jgi:ATP-dependent Lhr-like helicase
MDETQLFELLRRAWPYAALTRASFDAVLRMLTDGFTGRNARARLLPASRRVQRHAARSGAAALTAVMSGGTIPDTADYTVLLEPQGHNIGTRQRRLRGREPGRRRLPARQYQSYRI